MHSLYGNNSTLEGCYLQRIDVVVAGTKSRKECGRIWKNDHLYYLSSDQIIQWTSKLDNKSWNIRHGSCGSRFLNEGRNCGAWSPLLVIRRYLKFTAQSERELSVHPGCLHSFSSERWTWTSSDRTLGQCLPLTFLIEPGVCPPPRQKDPLPPPASPLSVSLRCWATHRVTTPTKWELRPRKPQDADDATLKSTADGEQTKGRCLWKNVYYELERLSTINLPPQRLTLILDVSNID